MFSPYVGEFASFNTGGVIDGYAKLVTFYQPELERALRSQAEKYENVVSATGVELLGFSQNGGCGPIYVCDSQMVKKQHISARYLIGADGGELDGPSLDRPRL